MLVPARSLIVLRGEERCVRPSVTGPVLTCSLLSVLNYFPHLVY